MSFFVFRRTKHVLEWLEEMAKQPWKTHESQQRVASMKQRIPQLQSQLDAWKDDQSQGQIKSLMAEVTEHSTESQRLSLMIDLFERVSNCSLFS
jgi:hypothetical protein